MAGIIRGTTVDGPGFRTSIYLSGCNHGCPGCHNPEAQNPEYGKRISLSEIMRIVDEEDFDVTLSGGDPLFHPDLLKILVEALKRNGRNVWIYTGFTMEEILDDRKMFEAVKEADVIVDGRFEMALKDSDLPFRGSSNQRIIDLKKNFETYNKIVYRD